MKPRYRMSRIACMAAMLWGALSGCAIDIDGRDRTPPRYRYISLDQALPPGFAAFTDPMKVTNKRRVYLNAWACPSPDLCVPSIAAVQNGVSKILHRNALFYDATDDGLIGGSVVPDPEQFTEQAALFKGGVVKPLPRMPGETNSWVVRVTDSGKVLVTWFDEASQHYYVYDDGKVTPLAIDDPFRLDMNKRGLISGTMTLSSNDQRAFRLNPFSGRRTLLDPLPTEPDSWGEGINKRGDVLGYSFVGGALERIGVWRGTRFTTYFVEGTPEFPTLSNRLRWNERGEIIITNTSAGGRDPNSYLVPRPGVRLKLADISDRLPHFWTSIADINERGDIVGSGGPDYFFTDSTFLLERIE